MARVMVWRCVAAVAALAVGLAIVIEVDAGPVAGACMAGGTLTGIMVRWRITAVAA